MKKIIHNLRKQPEEMRRHVLHISVFIVGFILLALWAFSLGTTVAETEPVRLPDEFKEIIPSEEEIPEIW